VTHLALEALPVAFDILRGALVAFGLGELEELGRLGDP
jgi:hypothetical protein